MDESSLYRCATCDAAVPSNRRGCIRCGMGVQRMMLHEHLARMEHEREERLASHGGPVAAIQVLAYGITLLMFLVAECS